MEKLFGTDGVRGTPGEFPLTDGMIFKLGKAASYLLLCENESNVKPLKIVIGKDTRLSGEKIEVILSSGVTSYDVDVLLAGVISTPGLAFLTKYLKADMGIMISASHNRAEENGIKLFSGSGYKLSKSQEARIEKLIFNYDTSSDLSKCSSGSVSIIKNAQEKYIDFLKKSVSGMSLKGFKVVIDCAHGAVSDIAPRLFKEMGADVLSLNNQPDGTNINLDCGALYPQYMAGVVRGFKGDIGLSFDGDADRVIISDENGVVLDGDFIMAMVGTHLIDKKKLPSNTLVTTVMSNFGLNECIENKGGRLIRTDVGDRYVVEECLKNNFAFGGEQSGHIVFLEHSTTGDGMLTALQILKIMKEKKKKLSVLSKCMRKYPQVLLNINVKQKTPIDALPLSSEAIRQGAQRLGGKGSVLVRYSGTEKLCRVMVEGEKEDIIKDIANSIATAVKKEIGA